MNGRENVSAFSDAVSVEDGPTRFTSILYFFRSGEKKISMRLMSMTAGCIEVVDLIFDDDAKIIFFNHTNQGGRQKAFSTNLSFFGRHQPSVEKKAPLIRSVSEQKL